MDESINTFKIQANIRIYSLFEDQSFRDGDCK